MMQKKLIHSLKLEDISVRFENGNELFHGLSMHFPTERVVWIHGDPGSGKSVLMRILAGLFLPTSGSYRINGERVETMTFEEFLPYRLNIGYSFDFGGLIHNRTIAQNLLLPLDYQNPIDAQKNREQVDRHLNMFRIDKFANERPSGVNGGVRKAACVARALVHEPDFLILDDPTTGLRGETKKDFQKFLKISVENKSFKHVFIATEDVEFMKEFNYLEMNLTSSQRRQERSAA